MHLPDTQLDRFCLKSPRKMTVPPTIDQFPTFADTLLWLTRKARKCIWHLPDKKRYCKVENSDEADQSALHLAESIAKAGPLTERALSRAKLLRSSPSQQNLGQRYGKGIGSSMAKRDTINPVCRELQTCSVSQARKCVTFTPCNFGMQEQAQRPSYQFYF